jgi:hypothetical protein
MSVSIVMADSNNSLNEFDPNPSIMHVIVMYSRCSIPNALFRHEDKR